MSEEASPGDRAAAIGRRGGTRLPDWRIPQQRPPVIRPIVVSASAPNAPESARLRALERIHAAKRTAMPRCEMRSMGLGTVAGREEGRRPVAGYPRVATCATWTRMVLLHLDCRARSANR